MFRGKDNQSDAEAATYLYFSTAVGGKLYPHTTGAILLNVIVSLLSAAWLSKSLSLQHRHLCCSIVYYFLRGCKSYISHLAKEEKWSRAQKEAAFFADCTLNAVYRACGHMGTRAQYWLRKDNGSAPSKPYGPMGPRASHGISKSFIANPPFPTSGGNSAAASFQSTITIGLQGWS